MKMPRLPSTEGLDGLSKTPYTGLKIKGGSGSDSIENDAKQGVVTDGNGSFDQVILGGSGATATLGNGTQDLVIIGESMLGTLEQRGSAVGGPVKFGDAAQLYWHWASARRVTRVLKAADRIKIDFSHITTDPHISDATAEAAAANPSNLAGALEVIPHSTVPASSTSPSMATHTSSRPKGESAWLEPMRTLVNLRRRGAALAKR